MLDGACARAKVEPVLGSAKVPANVEVTLREKDGARFLFLLNHGAKAAGVGGAAGGDAWGGFAVGGEGERESESGALGGCVVAMEENPRRR